MIIHSARIVDNPPSPSHKKNCLNPNVFFSLLKQPYQLIIFKPSLLHFRCSIEFQGKSVKRLMSYDRTFKQTDQYFTHTPAWSFV